MQDFRWDVALLLFGQLLVRLIRQSIKGWALPESDRRQEGCKTEIAIPFLRNACLMQAARILKYDGPGWNLAYNFTL